MAISGAICRCTGYKNIVARGPLGRRARGLDATEADMAVMRPPSASEERPIGFGRLKRKEDARFIRGQGTYLDDIRLPGMVHVRDPALARSRTRRSTRSTRRAALALPERRRRDHRQGPRDARARVDADDLLRHAGRARRRQGPLPGPGGRVRDRDRRVHRPRRAAADRRRVRPAARGRQRAQGARRRRAADPRRQGRPARQPRAARPGRPATRTRPTRRSPRPTRSSRATSSTRAATRRRWRRAG